MPRNHWKRSTSPSSRYRRRNWPPRSRKHRRAGSPGPIQTSPASKRTSWQTSSTWAAISRHSREVTPWPAENAPVCSPRAPTCSRGGPGSFPPPHNFEAGPTGRREPHRDVRRVSARNEAKRARRGSRPGLSCTAHDCQPHGRTPGACRGAADQPGRTGSTRRHPDRGWRPWLWLDIPSANAGSVADTLTELARDLEGVIAALRHLESGAQEESDWGAKALLDVLNRGVAGRERLPNKHGAPKASYMTITVPVGDQPGELARLFADIGATGVNIEDVFTDHDPGRQPGWWNCSSHLKPLMRSHGTSRTVAGSRSGFLRASRAFTCDSSAR